MATSLRAHDLSWCTRRYVYFHVCSSRSLWTLGPELVQIRPAPRVLLRSFGESCSGSLCLVRDFARPAPCVRTLYHI